jgi:uncharacterized membrane protein
MIAMAISLLWLLIGVVALCAVVWLVIYGIVNVAGVPIPDRVIQAVWFIIAILVVIGLLTILAGGSIGGYSLHMR